MHFHSVDPFLSRRRDVEILQSVISRREGKAGLPDDEDRYDKRGGLPKIEQPEAWEPFGRSARVAYVKQVS